MRGKKIKPTKKHSQTNKPNEHSLTPFLLKKHIQVNEISEPTTQTAMVLETILTGTDSNLQTVLESWMQSYVIQGSPKAIQSLIRGWGPSNSMHLFNRLLNILGTDNQRWTYPWIKTILRVGINLSAESIGQLNASLANESTVPLNDILRLEGKLQLFDH